MVTYSSQHTWICPSSHQLLKPQSKQFKLYQILQFNLVSATCIFCLFQFFIPNHNLYYKPVKPILCFQIKSQNTLIKKLLKDTLIIIAIGYLTGILTSFGQTYIPDPFRQLANSYLVWLTMSFVAGMLLSSKRSSLIGGALIQYLAIAVYYIVSIYRFDTAFSFSPSNIFWIVGGTIAGPVVGLLGFLLNQKNKWFEYSVAILPILVFSDAIFQFVILNYVDTGFVFVGMGLLIMLILRSRYNPDWSKVLILILIGSLLAFVTFAYILPGTGRLLLGQAL
jgi:hypothetical protein